MHLTTGRLAVWVVAALAVGVGAYLVGHGGASSSAAPSVEAAAGPHPMTLPKLTAVASLPSMKKPPQPKQPAGGEVTTEESPAAATPTEYESYETPLEETSSPQVETSGPSNESTPAPETVHEPTETAPSGGGEEELETEGG